MSNKRLEDRKRRKFVTVAYLARYFGVTRAIMLRYIRKYNVDLYDAASFLDFMVQMSRKEQP